MESIKNLSEIQLLAFYSVLTKECNVEGKSLKLVNVRYNAWESILHTSAHNFSVLPKSKMLHLLGMRWFVKVTVYEPFQGQSTPVWGHLPFYARLEKSQL